MRSSADTRLCLTDKCSTNFTYQRNQRKSSWETNDKWTPGSLSCCRSAVCGGWGGQPAHLIRAYRRDNTFQVDFVFWGLLVVSAFHVQTSFHIQNLFYMRRGDKENEWGSVSPDEITWCCWLLLWTSKRNTELPDSQQYFHRENLLSLPSSLNSEMGDGSWQTLWSTSVNIRSSQPAPQKKQKTCVGCLMFGSGLTRWCEVSV